MYANAGSASVRVQDTLQYRASQVLQVMPKEGLFAVQGGWVDLLLGLHSIGSAWAQCTQVRCHHMPDVV